MSDTRDQFADVPSVVLAENELVHRMAGSSCEEASRVGCGPCAGSDVPEWILLATVLTDVVTRTVMTVREIEEAMSLGDDDA